MFLILTKALLLKLNNTTDIFKHILNNSTPRSKNTKEQLPQNYENNKRQKRKTRFVKKYFYNEEEYIKNTV